VVLSQSFYCILCAPGVCIPSTTENNGFESGVSQGEWLSDRFGTKPIYCWNKNWNKEYRYAEGKRLSQQGAEGYNLVPLPMRETGDGECADLSFQVLNEGDHRYPALHLKLAGAILMGAQLKLSWLEQSDLRGVNLQQLDFGYALVTGVVDEYTEIPGDCQVTESAPLPQFSGIR
jgi:hypothetical protein